MRIRKQFVVDPDMQIDPVIDEARKFALSGIFGEKATITISIEGEADGVTKARQLPTKATSAASKPKARKITLQPLAPTKTKPDVVESDVGT